MYYTKEGKVMKAFNCDDWDALKELSNKIELCFITGDKKGFDIVKKRIEEEMNFPLFLVSHLSEERWKWIKEKYPNYTIIFMGDGIYDYTSLKSADLSFTIKNALNHIKQAASVVIERNGGDRAVAEACLYINKYYKLGCFNF